jgi:RNA polymerase sigma factor (TIGR02999 family)
MRDVIIAQNQRPPMADTSERNTDRVTRLLKAWGGGDKAALEELAPLVERELRRLARHYMRHERPGHTLQPTALVNEAFVRLIDWKNVEWQNRAHFFGVSAQIMRRILVDFARRRPHVKTLNDVRNVSLDDASGIAIDRTQDLVALDDALTTLEALDPRKARIVELRHFAGLSVAETAVVLGVAEITVMREWQKARAWLHRELTRE